MRDIEPHLINLNPPVDKKNFPRNLRSLPKELTKRSIDNLVKNHNNEHFRMSKVPPKPSNLMIIYKLFVLIDRLLHLKLTFYILNTWECARSNLY
jgi:hypothetical protein